MISDAKSATMPVRSIAMLTARLTERLDVMLATKLDVMLASRTNTNGLLKLLEMKK